MLAHLVNGRYSAAGEPGNHHPVAHKAGWFSRLIALFSARR